MAVDWVVSWDVLGVPIWDAGVTVYTAGVPALAIGPGSAQGSGATSVFPGVDPPWSFGMALTEASEVVPASQRGRSFSLEDTFGKGHLCLLSGGLKGSRAALASTGAAALAFGITGLAAGIKSLAPEVWSFATGNAVLAPGPSGWGPCLGYWVHHFYYWSHRHNYNQSCHQPCGWNLSCHGWRHSFQNWRGGRFPQYWCLLTWSSWQWASCDQVPDYRQNWSFCTRVSKMWRSGALPLSRSPGCLA